MKRGDNTAMHQSMLHRSFQFIYKLCAVSSSILISFMWVTLTFVEEDIKHNVNWYVERRGLFTDILTYIGWVITCSHTALLIVFGFIFDSEFFTIKTHLYNPVGLGGLFRDN